MFHLTNHEVWALTARADDRVGAQIATWVVPGSLATGVVRAVVVLSPANHTCGLITASGRFALHLLAEDQLDLLPRLGLYSGHDRDKLAGMDLGTSPGGLPVLPGTCGWAEMRVVDRMDGGDRLVVLADAVAIGAEPPRPPLRRAEAFARLPQDVRDLLVAKKVRDGERDLSRILGLAATPGLPVP